MMDFGRRSESRRKDLRFPVSLSLQLQVEGQDRIFGQSINISRRGLLCSIPREDLALFTKAKVFLDLILPNQEIQTVECEGVIFRIENGQSSSDPHRVALYFHRLDEKKARKIRECVVREANVPDTELAQFLRFDGLKAKPPGSNLSGYAQSTLLSKAGFNRASFFHSLEQLTQALVEEIKNPLAGISGALETVASSPYHQDSPYQEVYQEIFRDLGRIDDAVSTLLYYCNPVPPRMRLLRLDRLIDESIELLTRDMKNQSLEIRGFHSADQPMLWGDDQYLQQALLVAFQHFCDLAAEGNRVEVFSFFKEPPESFCLPGSFSDWRQGDGRLKCIICEVDSRTNAQVGHLSIDAVVDGAGVDFPLMLRNVEMHGGEVYWCNNDQSCAALLLAIPAAQGLER